MSEPTATSRIRAADLSIGDAVDLEGDVFADPLRANPTFEFEYAEVCDVIHETPQCVAIGFEGFDVVGFPPNHVLTVLRRKH